MHLHHISLTTGHIDVHRLDILDPVRVAAYRKLPIAGLTVPGLEAFNVSIRLEMITIHRRENTVILCAVGTGRTHAWNVLEALQATFSTVKAKPPAARWLGVVELPSLGELSPRDAFLLADFQRYLAAAILLPRQVEITSLDRRR